MPVLCEKCPAWYAWPGDCPSGLLLPDPAPPLTTEEVLPGLYVVRGAYAKDHGFFGVDPAYRKEKGRDDQ